jgi:putative transposase
MRYRRDWTPGGTWFFTVNLADRHSNLLIARIDQLRAAFADTRQRHPFEIIAIVIMPDHLHAILELPDGDADYAGRWSLIKSRFSRSIPLQVREVRCSGRRERGIWQRRYWEHRIRDDRDLEIHVDYIHYNPVKHGYVDRPDAWSASSIHRYIRAGMLPPGWAAEPDTGDRGFGETARD